MSKFAEFYETRNLLLQSTGFTSPLTYDEWKAKPDNIKAGLLFVQFFNEITLAWDKADSHDFGDDAEGASTILQYLQKQVSQLQWFKKSDLKKKATVEYRQKHPDDCIQIERRIIEENPKKFSASYIYKVAYNCLYCICGHDRKCDKERMNNEVSSIVMYDGKELCLFDMMSDSHGSAEQVSELSSFQKEFWSVIEDAGASAEKVTRYLLSQDPADLKALSASSNQYKIDPLRDIEVSIDKVSSIINELRDRFMQMPSTSICSEYVLDLIGGIA